jgi:hypothetical protein
MTDQPSQSPPVAHTVPGSGKPYPVIPGPTGEVFQVMSLQLKFKPGLEVAVDYPDSSDEEGDQTSESPSHKVRCEPVILEATVHFTGNAGWKIGWVQTVEPADFWVDYRDGGRTARHRTTMNQRLRDGDTKRGYWYHEEEESRTEAKPGADVTVQLYDDPNVPIYASGPSHEGLAGWKPAGCGGQKEFWAWLAAVREEARYKPADVVYLHHVHWKVDFACEIHEADGQPTVPFSATSGAVLLAHGAGPGGPAAVLDGPVAGPKFEASEVKYL